MTFKILSGHSATFDFIRRHMPKFDKVYTLLGSFYEHFKFLAGVDYEKSALEKFVKEYRVNPFQTERDVIPNLTGNLTRIIRDGHPQRDIMVVKVEDQKLPRGLGDILEEYVLFDVYVKKSEEDKYREYLEE